MKRSFVAGSTLSLLLATCHIAVAGAGAVAPTGLNAIVSNGAVDLRWNPVPGAREYTVYRGTQSGTEQAVELHLKKTTYRARDLYPGVKYYFEVSATSGGADGAISNEIDVTPTGGPTTYVVFDFAPPTTHLSVPKYVSTGSRVGIKVMNVNKFVYDVTLSADTKEFNTTAPDVFNTAFLPSKGSSPNAPGAQRLTPGPIDKFHVALYDFYEALNSLNDVASIDNTVAAVASSKPRVTGADVTTIQADAKNIGAAAFHELEQSRVDVQANADLIPPDVPSAFLGTMNTSFIDASSITGIEPDALRLVQAAEGALRNTHSAINPFNATADKDFSDAEDKFKQLTTAATASSPGKPSNLDQKFASSARTYQEVADGSAFEATREINASGDEVDLGYKIDPNDQNKNDKNLEAVDDTVRVPVVGGLRLNFSTGLFMSTLVDQNVTTATPNSAGSGVPTKKVVVANGSDQFATLTGALLHIYVREPWAIQPAFSAGVGLKDKNQQYLLGLSAILGSEHRAILTAGWSFGAVQRLAPDLSIGGEVPDNRGNITNSVNRHGWFIGLTYNLGPSSGNSSGPSVTSNDATTKK